MKETVNERIKLLITKKELNVNSFSVAINANPQTTHKILKGLNKPGYDYLQSVMLNFPDVDGNWLILGNTSRVPMGKTGEQQINVVYLQKLVETQEYAIQLQKEKIAEQAESIINYENLIQNKTKNKPSASVK
jgi:predicted transcriptional regulator